jgi:hypothetical protein
MVQDAISSFELDTDLPPPWLPQPLAVHEPDAAAPPAPDLDPAGQQRAAQLADPLLDPEPQADQPTQEV